MKVFLGWSGTRSKETAEALGEWLGQVIQAVEPWVSSDISKGARWGEEIADKLEEAKVGILCLNRENLNANWILFEAGALSKTKDAHVCTFLLDLKPTDIKQPLAVFQHTTFEEKDVRKLVHTINQAVGDAGERSLDEKRLDTIFDRFWLDIEEGLKRIAEKHAEVEQPVRAEREILEEILAIVRVLPEYIKPSLEEKKEEGMRRYRELIGEQKIEEMIDLQQKIVKKIRESHEEEKEEEEERGMRKYREWMALQQRKEIPREEVEDDW